MAVRVPRQDRGELRRKALVEAAVAVVGEHGPAAFSARAVAVQAKLPLGAVSYYFPVLDHLLGEALAAVLTGWLAHGESVATATATGCATLGNDSCANRRDRRDSRVDCGPLASPVVPDAAVAITIASTSHSTVSRPVAETSIVPPTTI